MEHFELCGRKEKMERYLESVKNKITPKHMTEEMFLKYAEENYKTPEMFGEFNDFCELTEDDEKKRDTLFNERDKKIEEIKKLRKQLEELMMEEEKLSHEVQKISSNICEIEGHRLSYNLSDWMYLHRTCLVCGQIVTSKTITDKDVVVKGKSDLPEQFVYRKERKPRKNVIEK